MSPFRFISESVIMQLSFQLLSINVCWWSSDTTTEKVHNIPVWATAWKYFYVIKHASEVYVAHILPSSIQELNSIYYALIVNVWIGCLPALLYFRLAWESKSHWAQGHILLLALLLLSPSLPPFLVDLIHLIQPYVQCLRENVEMVCFSSHYIPKKKSEYTHGAR